MFLDYFLTVKRQAKRHHYDKLTSALNHSAEKPFRKRACLELKKGVRRKVRKRVRAREGYIKRE